MNAMTDPLPHLRYERKFLASGASLAEVLAGVRQHPGLFREAYPDRTVNSLYLDSPARRDYFQHVNGAANRVKTRIRWYGPLSGHIERPTLERKFKRGSVSGKTGCPLPALHVNGGIAPPDLNAALDGAGMPENLRTALRHLEPAVVVSYRRHYFQSANGGFRLTVDSRLRFLRLHGATGAMTPVPDHPYPVIIELKYEPRHADEATRVAEPLPYRLSRSSKYVLGIERLLAT
jgi:hypothetical protein